MKRIISFVLCLSMLISMLPVSVFAAETEEIIPETAAEETYQEPETEAPTEEPTEEATEPPTEEATEAPTEETEVPAAEETEAPAVEETEAPAAEETEAPTEAATEEVATDSEDAELEAAEEETEPEAEVAEGPMVTAVPEMDLPSDEELFAAYANTVLGIGEAAPVDIALGDSLSGDRKLAYDALVPLIQEIASGARSSAVVSIGHNLGKVNVDGTIITCIPDVEVAFTGSSFVYEDLAAVMDALLHDMPYELYWLDKVSGYSAVPLVTASGKMYLTFSLQVSADYSATGAKGTYDLDTGKTGAASASAANAARIAAELAGLDDYEKLNAFKNRICQLTDYNNAASGTAYGDPWQLIHVFDGDESTTVVCEGYAKAFQYLCQLSNFQSDISCLTVTGDMYYNGNGGGHMWNVVSIRGGNYLVDVTNCDTGFDLFLAGAQAEDDGSYILDGVTFTYDADTTSSFRSDLLALASDYYDPDLIPEGAISGNELQKLVANLSGTYTLTAPVVVTGSMTLDTNAQLLLPEGLTITVLNGAVLKLNSTLIVNNGSITVNNGGELVINDSLGLSMGNLTVEEGGTLTINSSLAMGYYGAITVDGTLVNNNWLNVGMGSLTVNGEYVHSSNQNIKLDVNGTSNVNPAFVDLETTLYGSEGLQAALDGYQGGYASYTVNLSSPFGENGPIEDPMVISGTVTVSEGITLQLGLYSGQTDTLTIPEGSELVVAGELSVMSDAVLNVQGDVAVDGLMNLFGSMTVGQQAGSGGIVTIANGGEVFTGETSTLTLESSGRVSIEPNSSLHVNGQLNIPEAGGILDNCGGDVILNSDITFPQRLANSGAMYIYGQVDCSGLNNHGQLYVNGTLNVNAAADGYSALYNDGSLTVIENGILNVASGTGILNDYYDESNCAEIVVLGQMYVSIPFTNKGHLVVGEDAANADPYNGEDRLTILNTGSLLNDETGILEIRESGDLSMTGTAQLSGSVVNRGVLWLDGDTILTGVLDNHHSVHINYFGSEDDLPGQLTIAEDAALTNRNYFGLHNSGKLTVNGTLDTPVQDNDVYNFMELSDGTVEVNGYLFSAHSIHLPHENEGNTSAQLIVGEGGRVEIEDSLHLYSMGSVVNNGTIRYMTEFTMDEGASYEGNPPVSLAYDRLMDALRNGDDVFFDGTLLLPQGETILPALAEGKYLTLGENARLIVPGGASLTLNCPVNLNGAELIVEEGGTLTNCAELLVHNNSVTVSGELYNNGTIRIGEDIPDADPYSGTDVLTIANTGSLVNGGSGLLEICASGDLSIAGTAQLGGSIVNRGVVWMDGETVLNASITNDHHIQINFFAVEDDNPGSLTIPEGVCLTNAGFISLMNGGLLRVDGELRNVNPDDEHWGSLDLNGVLEVNGTFRDHWDLVIPGKWEDPEFPGQSGKLMVNEGGTVELEGGLYVRSDGAVVNNGTIRYVTNFTMDEGAGYEGNTPVSLAYDRLMDALRNAAANGEDVFFDGTLLLPQGETTLPALAERRYLTFGDNASVIVPSGAHLTTYCHINLGGASLVVEEGGSLTLFGELDIRRDSTIDGQLTNYAAIWLLDGAGLTVNGHLRQEDSIHVGIDGNASRLEINGILDCFSYLNLAGEECSLYVGPDATANFDVTVDEADGGIISQGFLQAASGHTVIDGTMNLYGLCVIGTETFQQENGRITHLTVNEGGTLNIEAKHRDPRATLEILTDGCLEVKGTLVQNNNSFLNIYGGGLDMAGTYDESGYGFISNYPADSYTGQRFFSALPEFPRDRVTLITEVASMDDIYLLLDEYENSPYGYTGGTLRFVSDFTLTESLDLPEGISIPVMGSEDANDPNTLYIPSGIILTTRNYFQIAANAELVNDGTILVLGDMSAYKDYRIENNGEISVEPTGTLVLTDPSGYCGVGLVGFTYVSDTEYGRVQGIDPSELLMVCGTIASEQDIRDTLAFAAEHGCGQTFLNIFTDISLANDLSIPATVRINLGTFDGVNFPTFTVPNDITVNCEGSFNVGQGTTLVIDGTWLGNYPTGSGTIEGDGAHMSQADLEALLRDAAGDWVTLDRHVRLEKDLELECSLGLANLASLTVPSGVTLTIGEGCELAVYGRLTVEEGGRIINNGTISSGAEAVIEVNGAYEAGAASSITATYFEGVYADIRGIDPALITLYAEIHETEDYLRDVMALREELGCGKLLAELWREFSLSDDLLIPENSRLVLISGCSLAVPEGITVTNNGEFHIQPEATLALDGTWLGNAPINEGTILGATQTMSDAEFRRLLSEAEGPHFELQYNVVLEADLTLPVDLVIGEHGRLTVPAGITLTNPSIIDIYGRLTVEEGAVLENETLWVNTSGELLMYGEYVGDVENWNIQIQLRPDGSIGSIVGIDPGMQMLAADIPDEQALHNFLNYVQEHGYLNGGGFLFNGFELTESLYIPGNVHLELNGGVDPDNNPIALELYVYNGVDVVCDGTFVVVGSRLTVDGQWLGNPPIVINGGSLGGSWFEITQDELQARLDEEGTVYLNQSVTLEHDLVIQNWQQLILESNGELIVPQGIRLENYGLLQADYDGHVLVEGTVFNAGTINAHMDGVIDISNGIYEETDWATIKLALASHDGNRMNSAIWGVPTEIMFITVDGNDENLIHEVIGMDPESIWINVYGNDMTLTRDLHIRENWGMTISGDDERTVTLTVPYGVSLVNDGQIDIDYNGRLVVEGTFTGISPRLTNGAGSFLYGEDAEILYSQETLEKELARVAEYGGDVYLSVPMTLTRDLKIPGGICLYLSGTMTVPEGRTLTVDGWIDVTHQGQLLVQKGGTLINNGGLSAINGGILDVHEGKYVNAEWARIHKHFQDNGEELTESIVRGIPYETISKYYDGWNADNLQLVLQRAELLHPNELNITIFGEMAMKGNMTFPENAYVRICDGGLLTVSNGTTLTNRGRIEIDSNGTMIVRSRGILKGNQPAVVSNDNAYYINESILSSGIYTEAQLRSDLAAAAGTGQEIFLSSSIDLTADLEIPENVTLTVSGTAVLTIPNGITLTNHGTLQTIAEGCIQGIGGNLVNDGMIHVSDLGQLCVENPGTFEATDRAETILSFYGDAWGFISRPGVSGVALDQISLEVNGFSESLIREILAELENTTSQGEAFRSVSINICGGELFLGYDLDIPDYVTLTVSDQGNGPGQLIVPGGITLRNYGYIDLFNGGWLIVNAGATLENRTDINVGMDGHLHIEEGGHLIGSHPFCGDWGSDYYNGNEYDHTYLESQLAEAAETGVGDFILSRPVRLDEGRDLVIPAGVWLLITGSENYLTIPENSTLINNGTIVCHMNGGLRAEGGTLDNQGDIKALNWGVVDITGGEYIHGDSAMVNNHHWAYAENDVLCHATVIGIDPRNITFHVEGDVDHIFHELIGHVNSIESSGVLPAGFNGLITGDLRMTSDMHWPGFGHMTIPEDTSFTITAGNTLYVYGMVEVFGQLIIEEGGRVVAYSPIIGHHVDAVVNNGGYDCAWYIPGTAVESFTVAAEKDSVPIHVGSVIRVAEYAPVYAQILALQYEILSGPGQFLIQGEFLDSPIIVSPADTVMAVPMDCGELTVKVTPVTGYREDGSPILCSISDTVTIDVPQVFVDVRFQEETAPDFFVRTGTGENVGIFAGRSTSFRGVLWDQKTGEEYGTEQMTYTLSDGAERHASLSVINGICTLTAKADLDAEQLIFITITSGDETIPPMTLPVTLMPMPETVDVLWYGEQIVSGETILYDLNRDGWNTWLQPRTEPACCALTNERASLWNGEPVLQWSSSNEDIATMDEYGNVFFQGTTGQVTLTMTTRYGEEKTTSVTFDVVELPWNIVFEDAPTVFIGGASQDFRIVNVDDGSIVDESLIRWSLCDQFGAPIASHAYASITEDGHFTSRAVADEAKVYLLAHTISGMTSLPEPLEVTLLPATRFVQILDVAGNVINDKYLLYDLDLMTPTYQLSAKVLPHSGTTAQVIWESDNEAVAFIDETGLIHTTGEQGEVNFTMTVTDLNGETFTESFLMGFGFFTNSFAVTASFGDGTVAEDLENLVLYGGETLSFTAEPLDSYGQPMDAGFQWSVEDESCASISSRGLLTTRTVKVPTEVTVILSSEDQFCTMEIPVTLLPPAVETENGTMDALVICNDFFFLNGRHTIAAEYGEQLYAVDARTGEFVDVTWTSSNESAAYVYEDGWVETSSIHTTCTITATDSFGRKASFALTIGKRSDFVEITSQTGAFELASGNSLAFTGTVLYSDGSSDNAVTWSMADAAGNPVRRSVATLSENGVITAAEGLTQAVRLVLWASPVDGNPLAEEAVTVTIRPAATGVEIFSDLDSDHAVDITNTTRYWDLVNGDTIALTAMVYPWFGKYAPLNSGNAMQDVTWTSSDPSVAEIASDGTVTCLKSGSVTITASANSDTGAEASFQLVITKLMSVLTLPETASVNAGEILDLKTLPGFRVDTQASNQALAWTMVLADESGNVIRDTVPNTIATLDDGVLRTRELDAPAHVLAQAASTDGSNLTAQCLVTIDAAKPVTIITQPTDVTVASGETAEVTVVAEGKDLVYQWYYKNPGASKFTLTTAFDGPIYSVAMSASRSGRQVYCLITDAYGNTVQSDTVTLSMLVPKLEIVTQPADVSVAPGETAEVTVEATGDDLAYVWYYKNPGASKFTKTTAFDGPTYSVTMSASRSGRQVYCVITDAYGKSVKTDTVTLSMIVPELKIVTQPTDVTVAPGETAEVTVEATGDDLGYVWYYKNPGASKFTKTTAFDGPTYSVTMSASRSGRQVYCVITDAYGSSVKSDVVTLSMIVPELTIVTQPTDVTVAPGETAEVTVEAAGDDLTYTWYYKNPGAAKFSKTTAFDGPTYSVTMSASRSGRQVYCVITDAYGSSVQTDTVTLSMIVPELTIVTQPTDVTVASGETAEVTVEAVGDDLTYTWYYKNPGASKFTKTTAFDGPTYSVTMSASRSGRQVYCVITDAYGSSVKSDTVTLSMTVTELTIVTQPTDVTVPNGETAAVTVEATGDGLTYEWYYKNPTGTKFTLTTAFDGPTYSVAMSASRSGRQVYCVITDAYGNSVQSDTVTLSMVSNSNLVIVQQPVSVSVANGEKAEVTVVAEGEGLSYVWYYKNPGSAKFSKTTAFDGPSYSVTMTASRSGRQVYCVITDVDGNSVQSDIATLSILSTSNLEITKQPVDVTVKVGETAAVTVEAVGDDLTYEWYYKNPGATKFSKTTAFDGPTYSVTMSESRSGRQVYCVITDADGNTVQSDTVTLSMVSIALVITKQPENVTVASGETASVTVEAQGEGLTYQWYFKNAGGSKFSLTTSFDGPEYSVTMSSSRSGRQVYCVITDVDGNTVKSNTVTLTMA